MVFIYGCTIIVHEKGWGLYQYDELWPNGDYLWQSYFKRSKIFFNSIRFKETLRVVLNKFLNFQTITLWDLDSYKMTVHLTGIRETRSVGKTLGMNQESYFDVWRNTGSSERQNHGHIADNVAHVRRTGIGHERKTTPARNRIQKKEITAAAERHQIRKIICYTLTRGWRATLCHVRAASHICILGSESTCLRLFFA